ncbi:ATP-binding protein [Pseudorhodoplanes sp.]|uniref:ATP-binding protein n=1 Tax=Pseudorhodoplanes sp. TaxID=1934341 RepID=UPI002CC4B815|nr:ATP-binding protein [Pseudorhodoplanes sp.]HWV52483.1 ATP-binding protein [Pseudorhodoplanes sp.]
MKRLLPQSLVPKSLFGQTLLLLLAGLIVSHAIGSFIYSLDREAAVRRVGGLATAQRIANVSRLVEEMPADWRERLVAGLSDRSLTVALTDKPPLTTSDAGVVADVIRDYLMHQLRLPPQREPLVAVDEAARPPFDGRGFRGPPPDGDFGRGRMMRERGDERFRERGEWRGRDRERDRERRPPLIRARGLEVAVPLADGQWLYFATALPSTNAGFSYQYLISMLVMALIIVAISIWAVRRMTAPLATVAQAADRLGRDVNAPPLVESGTIEMKQAASAFNAMQTRLRALIENRTRMLAALSHDLRTPLTLLRLRAENVDNTEERDKMLATISEMDAMIGATLRYAREQAADEPRRSTDVTALVQSVVDDMADAGLDVTMAQSEPVSIECQPAALKRALTNLIENAVKYGERARVSLTASQHNIDIAVEDDGPGIPEDQLTKVFEPFYRVEESRSRDTGGVGLGLAIAQAVVIAQNGTLTLTNRKPTGLRALIALPRKPS